MIPFDTPEQVYYEVIPRLPYADNIEKGFAKGKRALWEQLAPLAWVDACPHGRRKDPKPWPDGLGLAAFCWVLSHVPLLQTVEALVTEALARHAVWIRTWEWGKHYTQAPTRIAWTTPRIPQHAMPSVVQDRSEEKQHEAWLAAEDHLHLPGTWDTHDLPCEAIQHRAEDLSGWLPFDYYGMVGASDLYTVRMGHWEQAVLRGAFPNPYEPLTRIQALGIGVARVHSPRNQRRSSVTWSPQNQPLVTLAFPPAAYTLPTPTLIPYKTLGA